MIDFVLVFDEGYRSLIFSAHIADGNKNFCRQILLADFANIGSYWGFESLQL